MERTLSVDMDFIVTEILPRLGGITLVRCKCVCKTFYRIISSPLFIKLHLQYTASTDANRLIILPSKQDNAADVCGFNLDGSSSRPPLWESRYEFSVVGSYNGLLCIARALGSDVISIINPITQTYRKIGYGRYGATRLGFGFGFNKIDHDYKVVAILEFDDTKSRTVDVYSLRKNSWSEAEQKEYFIKDSLQNRGSGGGVLIGNSLLHWVFWRPSWRKYRIGSFDIQRGRWISDVLLPDYYHYSSCVGVICLLEIVSLDGRFSCSFHNRKDSCFDVWVMKEYGVRETWTVLLRIGSSPYSDLGGGGIVAVARIGSQVLLKERHGSQLFWFNTNNHAFTPSPLVGLPHITPHIYKNTLLTIPPVGSRPKYSPKLLNSLLLNYIHGHSLNIMHK